MTSPPRRPILSLKFKTPNVGGGDLKTPAPPSPSPPAAKPDRQPYPAAKAENAFRVKPLDRQKPVAKPEHVVKPKAKAEPKANAAPAAKAAPAISPDLFKAAIKAATSAIVHVVADPEWKSQDLLNQYQAAKEHATSTHRQQAKLVSTVATRRHAADIGHANVQNTAMRAAYAAALVVLAGPSGKNES